jgi:hypothetical protein
MYMDDGSNDCGCIVDGTAVAEYLADCQRKLETPIKVGYYFQGSPSLDGSVPYGLTDEELGQHFRSDYEFYFQCEECGKNVDHAVGEAIGEFWRDYDVTPNHWLDADELSEAESAKIAQLKREHAVNEDQVIKRLVEYLAQRKRSPAGDTARHFAILTLYAMNEPIGLTNGKPGAYLPFDILATMTNNPDIFEEVKLHVFDLVDYDYNPRQEIAKEQDNV